MSSSPGSVKPTFFGRIYQDTLELGTTSIPLLFLKYSPVYPYSGLPARLVWWKALGVAMIGSQQGFHELDIHGAIHVVLRADTLEPFGVLLAQHNHHRSYLTPVDFPWPADNRVRVAVAAMSNEPYLILPGHTEHYTRTIGNPFDLAYLFGHTDEPPTSSAFDRVPDPDGDSAVEVVMNLDLLPLDDPLYTSQILLGERKETWGFWYVREMSGPLGMDFYTIPALKNLADLMAFWYVDPDDETFFKLAREHMRSFQELNVAPILTHQRARLRDRLEMFGLP